MLHTRCSPAARFAVQSARPAVCRRVSEICGGHAMRRIAALAAIVWLLSVAVLARAQATAPSSSDLRWSPWPDTDTVFKPARYASLDEWKQRRDWLRGQVRF